MESVKSFTAGFTLPPLSYQLTREGNRPGGLDGSETIEFFMRPAQSVVLKINGAVADIADVASDTVRYDWQTADVDTEGDFRGWFRVTSSQGVEETPEFDIMGLEHSPGVGVETGAIARAARREIPVAWDMLAKLPGYGDIELQEKVETVKLFVLGSSVAVADEANLDRRVIDYLGKSVAIEVIPAAIDFWSNQIVSQTARGSDEVQTYPDRIKALEDKLVYLTQAKERMRLRIEDLLGFATERLLSAPAVDNQRPLVTPGLETVPAPFGPFSTDPRDPTREDLRRAGIGVGGF